MVEDARHTLGSLDLTYDTPNLQSKMVQDPGTLPRQVISRAERTVRTHARCILRDLPWKLLAASHAIFYFCMYQSHSSNPPRNTSQIRRIAETLSSKSEMTVADRGSKGNSEMRYGRKRILALFYCRQEILNPRSSHTA